MDRAATLALALALTACGSPQDRLSDQQANAEQGPIAGAPADDNATPSPSPAPTAADGGPILYKAVGNEPGWSLTVRRDRIDYLGNYGEVKITEPTPTGFRPTGEYSVGRLSFTIAPGPCSDGMSDLVYRQTVKVTADGHSFDGCGGGTIPQGSLGGTSWTVVAINGRPTGGGPNYYLRFSGNDVAAKFGCNSIGGTYRQNGDHISTGELSQNLMGCPEPAATFEEQGSTILSGNMRVEALSGRRIRLVSEAGEIDLDRAI